jgi:O-acetyl-ADP-ribose deacetylase (regulator of RNase III)
MDDSEIKQTFLNGRVVVVVGDITRQRVDAVVNAANKMLEGGSGVDGAIHRIGGPEILKECREIRRSKYPTGLPTGKAVITTAGNLPALHVIHTVGPIYGLHSGREADALAACYRHSLELAANHGLRTIAFPAISTGIYDYPREEAAKVSSRAIEEFLASNDSIQEVRLVFFSPYDKEVFLENHQFGD